MLEKIVKTKLEEIEHFKMPQEIEREQHYSLKNALLHPNQKIGLIAEIKKASPSKGMFKEDLNPVKMAASYVEGGADALSVLTERHYFKGDNENIRMIRSQVSLPILRKDFIIDRRQIEESSRIGADVILLIASILDPSQLEEFYFEAYEKKLEVIVEIHHESELEKIKSFTPEIIGINNRDLTTFKTDVSHTLSILPEIPKGSLVISESGIRSVNDINRLHRQKVNGVLVGETLMMTEDPAEAIHTLFGENGS